MSYSDFLLRRQALAEAGGQFQRALAQDGTAVCPCCRRRATHWVKNIIGTAARDLITLVGLHAKSGAPVHIREFTQQRSNFYVLKHWDLIEPAGNDDPTMRSSGFWSPTEDGVEFVMGRLGLPKYVVTYDDELIRFQGPRVTIVDVLPERYNHAELLARVGLR